MSYPLINGATINGAEDVQGTQGIDLVSSGQAAAVSVVHLAPVGVELVRSDYHSITLAQPQPNITLQAGGAYPLEMGAPGLQPTAITLHAGGGYPLGVGAPGIGQRLGAAGAWPLEVGEPRTTARLQAGGAWPLQLGAPATQHAIWLEGIDLMRTGAPRIAQGANVLQAGGAWPLELGEPGTPSITLRARQAYPLQVGRPAIDRGSAC